MPDVEENEVSEIAIELYPVDTAAADLARTAFSDEEILESNAVTGVEILTFITTVAKGAPKILGFFADNRKSFKDAVVKIGTKEISLQGYSMQEVRSFLDSGVIEKTLEEMKQK